MIYEYMTPLTLQQFIKNPDHEYLKTLLLQNTGETDFLDFKMKWIDFTKMAKHILAIANSGGGCIVVGVSQQDDGSIGLTGLSYEHFLDKADIDNKLYHLLPKYIRYRVEDYDYHQDEHPLLKGKRFQVVIIEYDPKYVPYTSIVNRGELRYGAIYIRQGTKSLEASKDKLVEIIVRKVQSGGSDMSDYTLREHLDQLRSLMEEVKKFQEDEYTHYLQELIKRKKSKIEELLRIGDTS